MQAGVSLLECAGRYLLNQRLRDMEENIDGKIENIIEDRKRSRKCKTQNILLRCPSSKIFFSGPLALIKCYDVRLDGDPIIKFYRIDFKMDSKTPS